MKRLSICIVTVFFLAGCNSQLTSTSKQMNSLNLEKGDFLKVHYIDVGQGDSTLFQVSDNGQEYTLLIDAGDFSGDEVVEYLQASGNKKINIAIGTHPDADHIGQLDQVIEGFDVEEVWLSGNTSNSDTFIRLLEAIDKNDVVYEEPRMGDQFELGPLHIEVLYPKQISGKVNEESVSLKLTYGAISFVFTGDAEKKNEIEMIESGANLRADFLHMGHHGSSTSTSERFLQAVKPAVAIYSAGKDNSYGHPHEEVVSLVQNSGIELYGTDIDGTIVVTTNGKAYTIETEKNGTIQSSENIQKTIDTEGISSNNTSCININTAKVEEIEEIVHIGAERAEDLIELRPYNSIEDLSRIKGIGEARIEDIKEEGLACVGGE
ncbi:MBL fold metallo-hydrolase [Robertmurraya kyonggiensis]|uniref:MBL fold metallo-hydrolase n=1 Tax=Robertmurraya kyonggiensis TaxID=1037680 RepID=A0A4U1DAE3_9BACI|nr:MBL fold metallo-hydrolase [Robertmurraya kyonggiensis]TKC19444.1 MBL fold metallo-hydrolase [Robertmurraya kyonggiensis]